MDISSSSPVVDLVRLALDAASLRHQAIASNIANVHSPGYQPLKVNFEEQLGFARGLASPGAMHTSLQGVRPFVEAEASAGGVVGGGGGRVALDLEMVKLAHNTVHYQSLIRALDKRGSIVSAALGEGRR